MGGIRRRDWDERREGKTKIAKQALKIEDYKYAKILARIYPTFYFQLI